VCLALAAIAAQIYATRLPCVYFNFKLQFPNWGGCYLVLGEKGRTLFALPGGLRFQPSEIMKKLRMPMMIALVISSDRQLPRVLKQIY